MESREILEIQEFPRILKMLKGTKGMQLQGGEWDKGDEGGE